MKTKLTFLVTALLLTFIVKAQNTITVDNSVGADADFSDLQSAISNSTSGDVIYVHASEINYGDITIDKPLNLIGFSHSDADKETMVTDLTLDSNASNTRITGFHITDDFSINNTGVTLTNLVFENNSFDDNVSFSAGGADDVIFRGNIIYQIGSNTSSTNSNNLTNAIISNNIITNGIYIKFHESVSIKNNVLLNESFIFNLDDDTGNLVVQDCIYYDSANSVVDHNFDGVIHENCLTYNALNGAVNLAGTGNVNDTDPQFVNATDDFFNAEIDDYHLQAGSPAIATGIVGDDMGIFNSEPFVFNNFGFTAGVPTVTITAITSQVAPGGTIEVTIQSNSN